MTLVEEVRARRLPPPPMCRAIRLSAHVSQSRLARELGVHRISVFRWETGLTVPAGGIRERYARLLDELQRAVA